jgi:hypothetical protein
MRYRVKNSMRLSSYRFAVLENLDGDVDINYREYKNFSQKNFMLV